VLSRSFARSVSFPCPILHEQELFYDGIRGVPGTCDVSGKCCRLISREFSTADLFPTPNQPRDGAAIDPILFPWGPRQLQQQWQVQSKTGQIAVTALQDLQLQARVSSYKLEAVTDFVEQDIDIPADTKDLLDVLFHPSGAVRPTDVIFEFSLMGPGVAERQEASLFWLASLVYLVIESALLDTLSVGIIKPKQSKVDIRISPAFCPAFVPVDDFTEQDRRLVLVRKKLEDALQDWPVGSQRRALPMESALIYKPTQSRPKGFKLDAKTNLIVVELIYVETFRLIWAVVYMAVALAVAIAAVIIGQMTMTLRAHLSKFRSTRFMEEEVFANVQPFMRDQKDKLAHQRHNPHSHKHHLHHKGLSEGDGMTRESEIVGYTDFFFVLENMLGDPHKTATIPNRCAWALQSLCALSAPLLVIWFISSNYRNAVLEAHCLVRADQKTCLEKPEPISQLALIVILVTILVFALELSAHYLRLAYTGLRTVLRKLFYCTYAIVCTLALVILLLVCLWVLLGVLLLPSKAAPYAAALAGLAANGATIWAKLRCFQHKVSRAVQQRMECMRPLLRKVPRPLLDSIMRQKLAMVLKEEGLSPPLMALSVMKQLGILVLIMVFLFIAFASFTDAYNLTSGLFNTGIVAVVCVAFNNQIRSDSNSKASKEEVFEVQERLSKQILLHLHHVHFQIQGALELFAKMKLQMREEMSSDEMSQMSETLSFLSTKGSDQEFEVRMSHVIHLNESCHAYSSLRSHK